MELNVDPIFRLQHPAGNAQEQVLLRLRRIYGDGLWGPAVQADFHRAGRAAGRHEPCRDSTRVTGVSDQRHATGRVEEPWLKLMCDTHYAVELIAAGRNDHDARFGQPLAARSDVEFRVVA